MSMSVRRRRLSARSGDRRHIVLPLLLRNLFPLLALCPPAGETLTLCMFLLLLLATTGAGQAQMIRHVPKDFSTIQAAIAAAQNGDTVLVAPGTYGENINFQGKLITVRSEAGPDLTIIDGGK